MVGRSARRVAIAAVSLVVTTLPVSLSSATSSATAAEPLPAGTHVPFRVGSYNIRGDRTLDQFRTAAEAFKSRVDVGGLQEILGNKKPNILREDRHWRVYQAPHLLQLPITWNASVFNLLEGTERLIADGRQVEDKRGGLMFKKSTYAVIARLQHVATGQKISVVNVHLIQGAVKGGRKWPGRPRTFGYFVDQMATVRRVAAAETAAGYQTFVLGDFNVGFAADYKERVRTLPFRRFRSIGMTSMWQGQKLHAKGTHIDESCPRGVQHCGAYIDQVWATTAPAQSTVAHDVELSDHYPIIATHGAVVPEGYTPPEGTVGFADTTLRIEERNKPYQAREPLRFRLEGDLTAGYARVELADGTATPGEDFYVDDSSLYDNDPGTNYVDVYRLPEFQPEADETFTLRLVDPVNTEVTVAEATGTILDDDH